MRPRIVPAVQGLRWLVTGWRLFRVAPFAWLAATFIYWFVMGVVSVLPVVGAAIAIVLVPAFTVGFMALARAAEHGPTLDLRLLFDGFRHHARSQIVLGVAYLAAFAAVLGASAAADGGALARWVLGGSRPVADAPEAEAMLAAAALAAAVYLPVMLAFWFAPPLAAWHSLGAGKALFFSFVACLLNWRALLAYGALAALVTLLLPLAVLNALVLAAGGALQLVNPLLVALIVVLLPVLFGSFYASYRDVFGYHLPQ